MELEDSFHKWKQSALYTFLLPKGMNYSFRFFHMNPTFLSSPALLLILVPTGSVPHFTYLEEESLHFTVSLWERSNLKSLGIILHTQHVSTHI